MNIHFLHTNDLHSQFENFLRLGAQLRHLRERLRRRGEFVLTFDIGDAIDRVRPETEATMGDLNARLLAALGYDGWVFGNNEGLTIPVERWSHLAAAAKTPVVCANLRRSDGQRLPGFVDTRTFDAGDGVRVGVFGLTPDYAGPYGVLGVQAQDPFATAAAAVAVLQAADCQVVVALSHLGLFADRLLAQRIPGIDAILGGHTHDFMDVPERVGQTAIFQTGRHALAFGHTVIEIDPLARQGKQVWCSAIPLRADGPEDAAMADVWKQARPAIDARLQAPVALLDAPLQATYGRESVFMNLLVDALLQVCPADIGVMMAGALNASLLAGEVQLQHVHGACSTPTRPLCLRLQGQDLSNIIAASIRQESFLRRGFGYGFRGGVIGWLAVANARVRIVADAADGRSPRLDRLWIGDAEVEADRWYRVVTCEYLWLSAAYPDFRRGQDLVYFKPLVRDVLLDAIGNPDLRRLAATLRYDVMSGD